MPRPDCWLNFLRGDVPLFRRRDPYPGGQKAASRIIINAFLARSKKSREGSEAKSRKESFIFRFRLVDLSFSLSRSLPAVFRGASAVRIEFIRRDASMILPQHPFRPGVSRIVSRVDSRIGLAFSGKRAMAIPSDSVISGDAFRAIAVAWHMLLHARRSCPSQQCSSAQQQ